VQCSAVHYRKNLNNTPKINKIIIMDAYPIFNDSYNSSGPTSYSPSAKEEAKKRRKAAKKEKKAAKKSKSRIIGGE